MSDVAAPHVDAVGVRGAHALNHSAPALISELVGTHDNGRPWRSPDGRRREVEVLTIGRWFGGHV